MPTGCYFNIILAVPYTIFGIWLACFKQPGKATRNMTYLNVLSKIRRRVLVSRNVTLIRQAQFTSHEITVISSLNEMEQVSKIGPGVLWVRGE